MARFLSLLLLLAVPHVVHAQNISTNTPIPPLQWINLSNVLQGTAHPPPLKDAAIGYDETSRNIIIYGGESEGGFAQGQTYLLNLDTLSWSVPTPPSGLQQTPPARSAALAGEDFAASNRHAFVIIGGKGSDGKSLSDVWAFDFNNQFWSPVIVSAGGPSGRWGASGGIDIRTPPLQDTVVPGPNNTFYMAGGVDGGTIHPLSEVWRLHLSGTLSSNLPNSSMGSWDRLSIGSFPARVGLGSTVVGQQVIAVGGCDTTQLNGTCARQDSFVLNIERTSGISPGACPAPRLGPAVTPNLNPFSSSFASQAFMLLGVFNQSIWNDDGGLGKGEVDVLDINAGTWTRVLPSGDPGTSGVESFPVPREGASVLSYQMGLVGPSRNSSADTIIFGGRDSSGNYLSEVWLLRAYKGSVTPSNPRWAGFGNGRLQSGIAADGSGVKIEYLSRCASTISTGTTTSSGSSSPTSTDPSGGTSGAGNVVRIQPYEASLLHKLFAALSLITLQAVVLIFRNPNQSLLTYIFVAVGLGGYGLGAAGFALAFTTISLGSGIEKPPSSSLHLHTGHGLAGLIFFIFLYVLVPIWMLVTAFAERTREPARRSQAGANDDAPTNSELLPDEKSEQTPGPSRSVPHSIHNGSPPSSPRPRRQSWGPSLWRRSLEAGFSSDTESVTSGAPRGFEVVNRPPRHRQPSGNTGTTELPQPASRSLGEIDWLLRRRSLNLVGELDYALTQAHHARLSTPGTADILLAPTDDIPQPSPLAKLPTFSDILLHTFTQASILGLSVLVLVELWIRASKVFFILFLIWTVAFYVILLLLAWSYRPRVSVLSTFFYWLRNPRSTRSLSEKPLTPLPQSPLNAHHPAPLQNTGPYLHQPLYRTTATDEYSTSHMGPRSVEADGDDEIDEITRQRRIEEEMDRREVSIVTMPKRRLWVTNPS
ncbi:hypothetical protein P691DRAFT_796346 [Macrolepiota fuliginosa MF-IS2]|uniref:Galactose oxidase n=1 Tax=Macrolepiota fuliginosa MF-IS2 TaxID=1400762 RepID=A0A9P5XM83_9AGAR|nr:hypothetical protein P691DRAFT_796346 [Macrolepiota fuliginosa MF-IS2]